MLKFINVILILAITFSCTIYSVESRSRGKPSICLQPPPRSEGICTIEIEGFYFDPQKNNCEKYTVGGCRLTGGQSFGSHQDCLATCVHGTRHIQDIRQE